MEQKEKLQEKITEAINKLAGFMGLEFQIEFREENPPASGDGGALFVSIYTSDDAKFLIGKNGQALKALEHVLRMILAKDQIAPSILLDINDYRKSRANYL